MATTDDDIAVRWDADEAVTRLFVAHYRSLVRLATLLVTDPGTAEEITQDAYVALHARWHRLRDTDKALAYLRTCVVNRARSTLRHRKVVAGYLASVHGVPVAPSAEADAMGAVDHAYVITELRRLPVRQREALVLRYYLDLSEVEIAETMGVSRGAVKSHAARGIAALRQKLERWP